LIYLDSAATTLQKPTEVAYAVSRAIGSMASPGRGGHIPAMRAAETVFQCRQEAAALFEVENPEDVVFTANATHGLNIAVHTLLRPGSTVLISGYEHNAVTRPLHGIPGITIKTASAPLFSPEEMLDAFERQLTEDVDCVICTHVSNVFGYILPVKEIASLCRERGVPFVLDASQSAGCLSVSMRALGAAFIAMPGHKGLYGPQGTGILLCGNRAEPLLHGGTGSLSRLQEMPDFLPDRLEAGTHNVCGIAGLLEGIRFIRKKGTEWILSHEQRLLNSTVKRLSGISGMQCFWTEDRQLQAGVLSVRLDGWDCEELGEALGKRGAAVRAGLHCAPLAHQTAGTLDTGTVRISFSAFNTPEETEHFGTVLERLSRRKR